jgi:hypothetical protein
MRALLFDGWASIVRVVASSAAIYVIVVVALHVIGARALAKMSAYDLVVTITLGSLVAATPITAGLSLADGAAAVLTFLLLQELTRQLQARSPRVHAPSRARAAVPRAVGRRDARGPHATDRRDHRRGAGRR